MPRYITSEVGARTITIPDAHDGFEAGVAALPNGETNSLKWVAANSPSAKAFFHDRTDGGDDYKLYPGVAWSMVVWIYIPASGWAVPMDHIIGLNQQNVGLIDDWPNWYIKRYSGSGILNFAVRDTYAGVNFPNAINVNIAPNAAQTTGAWHMIAVTHDPTSVTTELKTYFNGAYYASGNATGGTYTIFDPTGTDYELCVNHRANLAMSTFYPAAAQGTNIELAKLAIFQGKALTALEIADLYAAMTG